MSPNVALMNYLKALMDLTNKPSTNFSQESFSSFVYFSYNVKLRQLASISAVNAKQFQKEDGFHIQIIELGKHGYFTPRSERNLDL